MLNINELQRIMPRCDASAWVEPLNRAMGEFGINTPARVAMFLAQVAHESAECTRLVENLNYSTEGLMGNFGHRFSDRREAAIFAHRPEAIANRIYAGRLGNGDERSGDGWKFRGRGLIQITGRANYRDCGDVLGLDLLTLPTLITLPSHAARSAAWFFVERARGNEFADVLDVVGCTRRINGGVNGIEDRHRYYQGACGVLEVAL